MREVPEVLKIIQNYGLSEQTAMKLYTEIEQVVGFFDKAEMSETRKEVKGIIQGLSAFTQSTQDSITTLEFISGRAVKVQSLIKEAD